MIIKEFLLLTEASDLVKGFLCVEISSGLNTDPINNAPILICRMS
jgi:hypothetical protein